MKTSLRIAAATIAMLVFTTVHAQLGTPASTASAADSSKQSDVSERSEQRAKIKASIAAKKARPSRLNAEEKIDAATKGSKSAS